MTRDAFHQELTEIEEAVIQMAAFVESAIAPRHARPRRP